jgi:hypothetical protein
MIPLSFLPPLKLYELHQGLLSVEKLDDALSLQERGDFLQDVGVRYPFAGIIKSRSVDERYAAAVSFKVSEAIDLGCHGVNAMSNLNVFVARDQLDELSFG